MPPSPVLFTKSLFSTKKFESSSECIAKLGDCRVFKTGLLGFEIDENGHEARDFIAINELQERNNCKSSEYFNYLNGDIHSWVEMLQMRNIAVKQIAAGGYHLLVLLETGEVRSIGWNHYGQCGYTDSQNWNKFHDITFPENSGKVISCKGCGRHSLFLMDNGTVYTCGNNEDGRCGVPVQPKVMKPTLIEHLLGHRITSLGSGFWHSFFITEDGRCYACGDNTSGQLGLSMDTFGYNILYPTLITAFGNKRVLQAAGGAGHSLFLVQDERKLKVFAAGSNIWHQISQQAINSFEELLELEFFNDKHPIKVSCGSNFSIVLCKDGNAYSFGCSANGKTCQGHGDTILVPTKIRTLSNQVKDVVEGSNHVLLLTKDNKVYSCGWNRYNQCGQQLEELAIPTVVKPLEQVQVSQVSCGAFFSVVSTYRAKRNTMLSFQKDSFKLFCDLEVYCSNNK